MQSTEEMRQSLVSLLYWGLPDKQTYKRFAQITNVEWSYSRKRHFRESVQSFSRRVETEKAGFCLRYFLRGKEGLTLPNLIRRQQAAGSLSFLEEDPRTVLLINKTRTEHLASSLCFFLLGCSMCCKTSKC